LAGAEPDGNLDVVSFLGAPESGAPVPPGLK